MDLLEIKKLLRNFGLKLTMARSKVLQAFFAADRGITFNEIVELTAKSVDRVTIYRTLKSFEDIGFIHRIIGATDVPTYALSLTEGKLPDLHFKQHLHFCCTKCHGVFCLNGLVVPQVSLPEPYTVYSLNLTVVGICQLCTLSSKSIH